MLDLNLATLPVLSKPIPTYQPNSTKYLIHHVGNNPCYFYFLTLDMKELSVRANNYSLIAWKCYQSKYTPLYEKGIKQNQKKLMETTSFKIWIYFLI